MFKLSIITDEVSQDFEKAVAFAQEFGLDGVEIRSVWDTPVEKLTKQHIEEIRRVLSGTQLVVSSIASPFLKCHPNEVDEHLRILGRCIEIAEHLGCDTVRTFTFWRNGSLEERMDLLLRTYDKALFLAQRLGIRLAVENEDACTIGTGEELAAFLEKVNSPLVKACWDPQNDFYRTKGQRDFQPGYEAVKPFVAHVHIKDARVNPDTGEVEHAIVGEGGVNIEGQIRALLRDGYHGFVSLETHWRPEELPEDVRRQPGGSGFSEKAEYASRICMTRLKDIVRKVTSEENA